VVCPGAGAAWLFGSSISEAGTCSFSLGVVEGEGESCQGYMLMASMISPGRELREYLRSRRRDNFDGSVSRGLDADVNVMLTS
jgi:hypothetical protein